MNPYARESTPNEKYAKRIRWQRKKGSFRHDVKSSRGNRTKTSFHSQNWGVPEEE